MIITTNKLSQDIHTSIKKAAHHKKPVPETRFHKHNLNMHYGLYVPEFRKIMKDFKPFIEHLTIRQKKKLAMDLMKKRIGELSHAGLVVVTLGVHKLTPRDFVYIDRLMNYFTSWSQVDHMCSEVLQPLLPKYEKQTVQWCWKWATSQNRWKRRTSVVIFTRRVGASGMYTDILIELCEYLKRDTEDIVQKGIGWALKDTLKSTPTKIINYVKKLRRQGVSSTITLYAIRDLKGRDRKDILAIKAR
jgi:3-methyladenine DNA glycosylase AlkD